MLLAISRASRLIPVASLVIALSVNTLGKAKTPHELEIIPTQVAAPDNGNTLSLRNLTPGMLSELKRSDLQDLLTHLGKILVQIKWRDRDGNLGTGHKHFHVRTSKWDQTNAAAALTLAMGSTQQDHLVAMLAATAPESVLPDFLGKKCANIFDDKVVAESTTTMVSCPQTRNGLHPKAKRCSLRRNLSGFQPQLGRYNLYWRYSNRRKYRRSSCWRCFRFGSLLGCASQQN